MRIYLKISYDGSKFQGFQQQTSTKNTILNKLILALNALGIKDVPVGSGRTDKGVHASNQALHLDIPPFWSDLKKLKIMLNRHLNPHIHVKKIYHVKKDFHARFSPIKREYRYIFYHGEFSPFLSSYVHFYPSFDMERLNDILELFKGRHDFEYFKKNGSESKNFIREIYNIKALPHKNKTIVIIQADGFLRSQIRMIISAVLKVYEGKLTHKQIKDQLDLKSIHTETLSPANGLYLHRVFYPKDIYK
ncbi:MAG: tRNA pseudouridine(38-40) synthase TruA [Proteobacteria bacterium]|nr:MAG: tRNA pseudouridine(38-40) synthase TruA [Pseudomonadota bacterium]